VAMLLNGKLNAKRNDELRQKFIDKTIPQAELIGLTIPDNNFKLDEKTGHYIN
jgi:ring-1,2-phenylacetyl-CoA epoxidase subunit PaaA